MKFHIKEIFAFTKAERRGVFVLSLFIIIILLFKIFWTENLIDFGRQNQFQAEIHKWITSNEVKDSINQSIKTTNKKETPTRKKTKKELQPHLFDPNQMTYTQWVNMGLTTKQARMIENYKLKGGTFNEPDDLRKIYSISESDYMILEPFIIINVSEEEFTIEVPAFTFDLNLVDIIEIQKVRGIGPSYAKRIVNYRKLLGGYININQLHEVYGIDEEIFNQISTSFTLTIDSIKPINLNKTDYSKLRKHPYISEELAYEITSYRKLHGNFKLVNDLNKLELMNDSLYQKIYLYFAVEPN